MRRGFVVVALLLLSVCATMAEDRALVRLDLPDTGPAYQFGGWLQSALAPAARTRWPDVDERGALEEQPDCIVSWSRSQRPDTGVKLLQDHVRAGGGAVFVVGAGDEHVRYARAVWGPLDVNIQAQDRSASDARWVSHPLTEGGEAIGAVETGSRLSGDGGSPLIRAGGATVAIAFDWGPLGRAVLIDEGVIFDQLHEASPRPALRDFIVRAAEWAAQIEEREPTVEPERASPPSIEELIGAPAVDAPVSDRTIVILPETEDHWAEIHPIVMRELERRDLNLRVPRVHEGDPVFTSERLDRAGLLVLGPQREKAEWTEPHVIRRFFQQGGRILCIPHARGGTQERMVGLNELLRPLRITANLSRPRGTLKIEEHAITERLSFPDDLRIDHGAQIWAPLASPLVTVNGRMVAAAYQEGEGRIVIIDGEFLRLTEDRDRPDRDVLALLRRSLRWLLGDL